MRYKYIAAYKVIGVEQPKGREEEVLIEPSPSSKALLTYDLDDHLFELDRATVWLWPHWSSARTDEGTFAEILTREIEALREKRRKEVGDGVFFVFEAGGEVESLSYVHKQELSEFAVAFDVTPDQPIVSQYQPQVNGLMASFALGSYRVLSFRKVKDGVIFFDKEGKPLYPYVLTAGRAFFTTAYQEDLLDFVRKYAGILGSQKDLVDSTRLLAKSLSDSSDDLMSFISAWSGLEIFVNKNFRLYEERAFSRLGPVEDPPIPTKFMQRIREVMKDKYRLADKFSVISANLSPNSLDEDVEQLERIKKVRDYLMHGRDVDIASLPTEETQKLLRKYLRLHVEGIGG